MNPIRWSSRNVTLGEERVNDMLCRQCGNQQDHGLFCRSCGRPLEELPVQTARTLDSPPTSVDKYGLPPVEVQASAPAGTRQLAPVGAAAPAGPTVYGGAAPVAPALANSSNVSVNVAGPQIIYQAPGGPGLLVRALWFVFIGWYVGGFWIFTAWALNLTIIGLPLGLAMFNAVPKVMTLKAQNTRLNLVANADGTYTMSHKHVEQYSFKARAVYFLLIGWWFSLVWAAAAYTIGLLIVTLPISFLMFDRMPAVTTLARY